MAKSCVKCGAELEDNAKFCAKCGTSQETANESTPSQDNSKNSDLSEKASEVTDKVGKAAKDASKKATETVGQLTEGMNKNVLIGIVAAAAIVVLIIICTLLSGGAKSTVKDYMKAFRKGNTKTLINLTIPKDAREDIIDQTYGMEVKEYIEEVDGIYDAMWKALKDEGKIKFDYEIKECEKLGKLKKLKKDVKDDYDIKNLDDFQDMMEKRFDSLDVDLDADDIKSAYAVELKYILEVDGDKLCKENSEIVFVYKYKGSWYLAVAPLSYEGVYYAASDEKGFKDVVEEIKDAKEDLDKALEKQMEKKYKEKYNNDEDDD